MRLILILSTVPHYLSLYFFKSEFMIMNNYMLYKLYFNIAFISSTLSIIWHLHSEPPIGIVMTLDYIFAYLWSTIEILISAIYFDFIILETVILMNIIVCISYIIHSHSSCSIHYMYSHSIWHVISFIKCIYVSYLLNQYSSSHIL